MRAPRLAGTASIFAVLPQIQSVCSIRNGPTSTSPSLIMRSPENEYLSALVSKFMVHGHTADCRRGKFSSPAVSCKRRFPASLSPSTHLDEKTGRWIYQRSTGDEMVVPYSPYLLQAWGGHCNVLACSGSKQIGYLFGYVQKGTDITSHPEH